MTTGAGTTVTGGFAGFFARDFGSGALDVTANGDVTGINRYGIIAQNFHGTNLSVTTGPGTTVTGVVAGIFARNFGSGRLDITVNGDVTGTNHDGTTRGPWAPSPLPSALQAR